MYDTLDASGYPVHRVHFETSRVRVLKPTGRRLPRPPRRPQAAERHARRAQRTSRRSARRTTPAYRSRHRRRLNRPRRAPTVRLRPSRPPMARGGLDASTVRPRARNATASRRAARTQGGGEAGRRPAPPHCLWSPHIPAPIIGHRGGQNPGHATGVLGVWGRYSRQRPALAPARLRGLCVDAGGMVRNVAPGG